MKRKRENKYEKHTYSFKSSNPVQTITIDEQVRRDSITDVARAGTQTVASSALSLGFDP